MRTTLELTNVPTDEQCEQLGPNYDPVKARREANAFKEQLMRQDPPPGEAYLKITSNAHDFGDYLDVVAVFDDENPIEIEWAYRLEGSLPTNWDDISKKTLNLI